MFFKQEIPDKFEHFIIMLIRFKSFLITDMTILGKTIQTVVTGKGAH